MNRRQFIAALGLTGAAAAATAAFGQTMSGRNPYYNGPVSDHFDGERFFLPGHARDKSRADLSNGACSRARRCGRPRRPAPLSIARPSVCRDRICASPMSAMRACSSRPMG
jgi:hypothetical protein